MPCAATTNLANVSLQTRLISNRGRCMKAAAVAHVSAVSKVGSFGDLLKRTSAAPKTSNSHHHGKQHWMAMFEKHWLYITAPCHLDPYRNPLRRCRTAQNSGPTSTRFEANNPCCIQCLEATSAIRYLDLGNLSSTPRMHTPDVQHGEAVEPLRMRIDPRLYEPCAACPMTNRLYVDDTLLLRCLKW
ncbi:hypothetical protein IG631_11464 [Alternaria alternata]|nr:hypothetical protein IG631_11464 [Alternaria alternata]